MMRRYISAIALAACGGDTGPDKSECTNVDFPATLVPLTQSPTAAPVPMGGHVESGTYFLTSATDYMGTPPPIGPVSIRIQIVVDGEAVYEKLQFFEGRSPPPASLVGTHSESGTHIAITDLCGSAGPSSESFAYDATPTTLTLYTEGGTDTLVRVFTAQ